MNLPIRFENRRDTTVLIDAFVPTFSCTVVGDQSVTLASGESAEVGVSISTPAVEGPNAVLIGYRVSEIVGGRKTRGVVTLRYDVSNDHAAELRAKGLVCPIE